MPLACGCACALPAAIAAFHRRFGLVIARVLSRRRASVELAADVTQIVYERLLVAPAGTRAELSAALDLGSGEWASIVDLVRSRLSLSLSRQLR